MMHKVGMLAVFAAVFALVPVTAEAETPVEIEAGFGGAVRGTNFFVPEPGLRLGVGLTQSLTLLTGISASAVWAEEDDDRSTNVGIPLELKWYLRAPQQDAVVPTLRTSIGYFQHKRLSTFESQEMSAVFFDQTTRGVRASALAGVAFFPRERLGVMAELGPAYSVGFVDDRLAYIETDRQHSLELDWRLTLVYRL